MANTEQPKELSALSASKIKSLENCSWLYWANYHLKLPQSKNDGARKGDVCHWMFETLIADKHQKSVDLVVEGNTVCSVKAVERLLKFYIKRSGLSENYDIFKQCDEMILVGLKNDFKPKGGMMLPPEFKFDISNPNFRIKGFIDKPFLKGDTIFIDDYKSAKQKFKGEDEESNIQALMYSYAARTLWPDKKPIVRFIFLQYPDDPIMTCSFSNETLKGFESFLVGVQQRVNMFNEISAKSSFAADQESHDQGFNGKLLCGFAKSPEQKKKDGTKMWHCSYKFPFKYFVVKKDNKVVYSVIDKTELKPLNKGEIVEELFYSGCPKYRNAIDDIPKATVTVPKKYTNVLDDF